MKLRKVIDRNILLVIIYCVMAAIAIKITPKQFISVAVNGAMFIIVALIFFNAIMKFRKVAVIKKELIKATKRIKEDFESQNIYLYKKYDDEQVNIFEDGMLSSQYKEYKYEMNRLSVMSNDKYKCDIGNYISKEYIDAVATRNIMNLIPGSMTGFGILGTFIGLSFGLQNFSTDSAKEITDSIAPLMDGIKVAFHTSIYGMVFSLVFNYVYKCTMEDVYDALEDFYDAYSLYVTGDSINDNESTMHMLIDEMPARIGEQLESILTPTFEKMNETLDSLSENIDKRQMEGMATIVDKFIEEMNKSLGDNFTKLGEVIQETCELQKNNNEFMQGIMTKINDMTQNIIDINELSDKVVERLAGYIEKIEELQKIINENFMSVNLQLDEHNQIQEKMEGYISVLVEHEKQITETSKQFSQDMESQLEMLSKMEKQIAEETKQNLETLATNAEKYNNQIAEAAKKQIDEIIKVSSTASTDMTQASQNLANVSKQLNSQLINSLNATFDTFDKNLSDIAKHLSGTISEVKDTTDRVPETVKAAYEGMEESFSDMQSEIEAMVHAMDIMQRNIQGLADGMQTK